MRILVTGATGLLGNNITRLATEHGFNVAGLCRSDRNNRAFQGLDLPIYSVDLSDTAGLSKALDGNWDAIIHCAAHIHIGWTQLEQGMQVNRTGTENVLREAHRRNIKVIHVSTVNTLTVGSREKPANEDTTGDGQIPCTYVVTKRAAEQAAIDAAAGGQNVVIVHPGFMLGPWDWKPSSGRMVLGLNGFAPLAPSGGCTVCDPRDVAQAILNAIEQGVAGRHYILGGENLTYFELWKKISSALGKSGPFTYMRAPGRIIASHMGDLLGRILGREFDVNSAAIGMASQFHWYSSQRAMDELDYQPRAVDESVHDSVDWLRKYGYLK